MISRGFTHADSLSYQLTGGISLGKVTVLVNALAPLSGHVSSTSFICSHRSALVLTSVIKPYLTERLMYASFSTFSVKFPLALMRRSLPLYDRLAGYAFGGSHLGWHSLLRRIWVQIDIIDSEDVITGIVTEIQRILTGHGEVRVHKCLLLGGKEEGLGGNEGGEG